MEIPKLTRQQKRQLERQAKKQNKTINLSVGQYEQLKRAITEETSFRALLLMLAIPMMIMRDKYGWGKKRLTVLLKQCINLYDSFDKDYVTLDDLHDTILEETGINIFESGSKFYFEDRSDK